VAEAHAQSPPDADPTLDERRVLAEERKVLVAALDADFKAMRAEIGRLIDHQKDIRDGSLVLGVFVHNQLGELVFTGLLAR
jgi:hypothetical protein